MPRLKRPRVARLEEVRITREKEQATIKFLEHGIATTHLTLGPGVSRMSDKEILVLFNETIQAQGQFAASDHHIAIEIPEGSPQVRYFEKGCQWVPRGDVLRCLLDDSEDEVVIEIDGREFSLEEFGRMLTTFSGWGMRICFVPEDKITQKPEVEVREPENE